MNPQNTINDINELYQLQIRLVLSNECAPTQKLFSKLKSDVYFSIANSNTSRKMNEPAKQLQPTSKYFCQTQHMHTLVYLAQKIQA